MKALEFDGRLAGGPRIAVPADVAGQIPPGAEFHVILLLDHKDEDWSHAGALGLASAYCDEDAAYEQLAEAHDAG